MTEVVGTFFWGEEVEGAADSGPEAVEGALGMPREAFQHAWDILSEYGNMSSPTALFVLERTLSAGATGRHLLAALGPGFTVSFCLLDL